MNVRPREFNSACRRACHHVHIDLFCTAACNLQPDVLKSGIIPLSALVSTRVYGACADPSAICGRQVRGTVSGLDPTFPRYLSILIAVILNMADTMDEGTV